MMRFRMRPKHKWMRGLVSLGLLVSSVLRLLLSGVHNPATQLLAFLQPACLLAFGIVFFQRSNCEFQESGLVLRQGWRKSLIPYPSLAELMPIAPPAGKFTPGRILVSTSDGRRLAISVIEKARFLREAYRRCPQLNPATASQIATLMEKQVSP